MKEKIYIIFKNNEEEYDDYSDWIIEIYKDKERAEKRFVELVKTNQYKKDRAIRKAKYNENIGAYRIEEHEVENEKRQNEVIDTNASNIEEDIKYIEDVIALAIALPTGEVKIQEEEIEAMQHILSDYKRVLKENEELLELKVSASAHNRILELEKDNEELKEAYKSEKKMKNEYVKLYQNLLLKENVIPIQKIKGKIEDLKMSGGSDGKDNTENTGRELAIEALQDILEESEE